MRIFNLLYWFNPHYLAWTPFRKARTWVIKYKVMPALATFAHKRNWEVKVNGVVVPPKRITSIIKATAL
jgi:hypothetical protein